jgi:1-deoxy-D-xylulose-5-phosphate reductoisomerase
MRIAVLGSTGSIGRNALEVAAAHPARIEVVALASRGDHQGLVEQARAFRPALVALMLEEAAELARKALAGTGIAVRSGAEGVVEAASLPEAETVISAIVGSAGIVPTFAAVQAGKRVALANKESLVAAGSVITAEADRTGAALIPVDSEHSAVFQALLGQDRGALRRVVLTASGGPFLNRSREEMERATPASALAHPRWQMGKKVTIDSATMMNKGLEVIEAHWLFGLPGERIEVLVHPQSIVHSLAEFADGSMMAQMGVPDMRLPIAFALSCPERWESPVERLDLARAARLDFFAPDPGRFPCLALAYRALAAGRGAPAALNAANEAAVEAFLAGRLPFGGIARVVEAVLDRTPAIEETGIAALLRHDAWARAEARALIEKGGTC